MRKIALSLKNISKSFDGQKALDHASFEVRWGEVHALLGENGAGKSTLMNVVCGLYAADDGGVFINEEEVNISSPADAAGFSVGMVHQHFKLIEPFTVSENLMLSCGSQLKVKSLAEIARLASSAGDNLGFKILTDARVGDLSVAERQRIEIIKLTLLGADILILDEPTAVLTDEESTAVLSLLQHLASQGRAVVLITHRLDEVTGYADKVTVMRAGKTVVNGSAVEGMTSARLAEAMVGNTVDFDTTKQSPKEDAERAVRLELRNLCVYREDKSTIVDNLNLSVRAGEIMGVAGVGGNGQTEISEAILGLREDISGNIILDRQDVTDFSIGQRRQLGLRTVPADRFGYALLTEFRAYENLALTDVPLNVYGSYWRLSRNKMKQNAHAMFSVKQITGGNPTTRTRLLSGGNAQKLLLARELDKDASVLVAHSPTRGLDVRAHQAVHKSILGAVHNDTACLLISEDLDEVLQLSTRICVISRGGLSGPYSKDEIDRARIGELMAGHV